MRVVLPEKVNRSPQKMELPIFARDGREWIAETVELVELLSEQTIKGLIARGFRILAAGKWIYMSDGASALLIAAFPDMLWAGEISRVLRRPAIHRWTPQDVASQHHVVRGTAFCVILKHHQHSCEEHSVGSAAAHLDAYFAAIIAALSEHGDMPRVLAQAVIDYFCTEDVLAIAAGDAACVSCRIARFTAAAFCRGR